MTLTLMKIQFLILKRDYIVLMLIFVLPILFFSITALIFGKIQTGPGTKMAGIKIIIVDEDQSSFSRRLIREIGKGKAFEIITTSGEQTDTPPVPFTRGRASEQVRGGKAPVAVILPSGLERSLETSSKALPVEILYDAANPAIRFIVYGILKQATVNAAPYILIKRSLEYLEYLGMGMTPGQRKEFEKLGPVLRGEKPFNSTTREKTSSTAIGDFSDLFPVKHTDVRGRQSDMISYYAAGVGVMFLLFSMAGAGGVLLAEEERGTLERLLNSQVGMGRLLLSNWMFYSLVGFIQLLTMFIWGSVVFTLDLWTINHLSGFGVMTITTAAAASAFGIILATLCSSRAQLSGVSTVVILTMSALGGSMVPRFMLPDFIKEASHFTLNGWALDGYLKVFWYDNPTAGIMESLVALWPQVIVLIGMTAVFLAVALRLSRRWEKI